MESCIEYAFGVSKIVCESCVEALGVCAKCGQDAEAVTGPLPTQAEQARLEAEYQRDLKALPERKRRTFLRHLERQSSKKKGEKKNTDAETEQTEDNENDDEVDISCSKTEFQIKQEAHKRLKELVDKYAKDDDFFFDDDDFEEEDKDE